MKINCLHPTIWVVGLAEVQVVAGPGRIVLGAHGELHALDVLFEVVEGSKDILHSLHTHTVVCHSCVSLHLGLTLGLSGRVLDGQRLNDITGWTLQGRSRTLLLLTHIYQGMVPKHVQPLLVL